MIKVVAFDPGVTTGYAMGEIDEGLMHVVTGQMRWSHKQLYDNLLWFKPDRIVCESFEFRRQSRDNIELYSRELIGVIALYAEQNSIPTTMQMPGLAIGGFFKGEAKLKADRLYKPGQDHANDAVRHLLYWYQFGEGFQFNERGYEAAS